MRTLPRWTWHAGGWSLLLAMLLLAFSVGQFPVRPAALLQAIGWQLFGIGEPSAPAVQAALWHIRLPRVLAAMLIGAVLSAAGAAYQAMFRNPLVSPDILGVSAGAGLGASLGLFLGLPMLLVQGIAFAGGLGAVGLVCLVAALVRRHDPVLVLVLAGVAVSALLGAGISLLKLLADPYTQLPSITFWLLGGLNAVVIDDLKVTAPLLLIGLVPLVLLRWRVNLLGLGDEEASALGVAVTPLRWTLIAAATLCTAAAVSLAGIIGWVGLVVPHIARLLVGADFRRLLPASLLLGASFLLAADTLARTLAPIELPLGILTAFVGVPCFLLVLARSERRS
ncbi:FecCD family ABC transporter permease [Stenotrophomonas maltophilia]|uniref:FecCD family ABC transporter permease n=1 Tax=Stenotrophomonas maltophilia TaxID=40324 RepID=UPI001312BF51|nr:iron ABC transporter permease [Stenotrophomonas maltophilia]MBA0286795.1 iron ABC transporter permease [Stenotrophomonas maltophilia]MBA0326555.1 iron ABC transporter permease [Stenotrophomonas maltophilia]